MASVNVSLAEAPATPLNLQLNVAYSPRVPTPPFVGFAAMEVRPDWFEVVAYSEDGSGAVMHAGPLYSTFMRLAQHLRMDV